jgi:hypothetical protein
MNTVRRIWTILSVLFIHETNYIILQFFTASFFYSILSLLISLSLSLLQYNNKLSKDWLHELSLSCLQPILSGLSGYLPCPITITISYYPIRAEHSISATPYSRIRLYKQDILKNVVSKISQQLDLLLS